MKITLIHCYSDFNKGDLGIILSTIKQLKKKSPESTINGVSTYDYNHSQYSEDHKILKKYIDTLYPCIFGLLFFRFRGKEYNNSILKILKFTITFLRVVPLLLLPKSNFLLNVFLNKEEKKTFNELLSSDVIISKGGSFLCNENHWRSKIAFFRLVYINLLLAKYDKKYLILGQSIGPVYGSFSRKILNKVMDGAEKVFLREKLCLSTYPYISQKQCSDIIVNDIAFTMDHSDSVVNKLLESPQLKIGLTVKYPKDNTAYNEMMLGAIKFFIETNNALFIIFPQVTVDRDIEKAKELYYLLEDKYKSNVFIFNDNYTPTELRYMYSKMDLFVGTRLHSTIFTMSSGVPCINIEYHGTKSLGIYQELEIPELVITKEKFNSQHLIDVISLILNNDVKYRNHIKIQLDKINKNIALALSPYIIR